MRVLGTMSRFLFLLRPPLANPSIFQFVLPYKSRAFNFLSRPRILRAGEEKMNLCVGWFINQNGFIMLFDRMSSTGTVYQILEYLCVVLRGENNPKQFEKKFSRFVHLCWNFSLIGDIKSQSFNFPLKVKKTSEPVRGLIYKPEQFHHLVW